MNEADKKKWEECDKASRDLMARMGKIGFKEWRAERDRIEAIKASLPPRLKPFKPRRGALAFELAINLVAKTMAWHAYHERLENSEALSAIHLLSYLSDKMYDWRHTHDENFGGDNAVRHDQPQDDDIGTILFKNGGDCDAEDGPLIWGIGPAQRMLEAILDRDDAEHDDKLVGEAVRVFMNFPGRDLHPELEVEQEE